MYNFVYLFNILYIIGFLVVYILNSAFDIPINGYNIYNSNAKGMCLQFILYRICAKNCKNNYDYCINKAITLFVLTYMPIYIHNNIYVILIITNAIINIHTIILIILHIL
jgi:hypothetical protein